jgi:hypothetical protein
VVQSTINRSSSIHTWLQMAAAGTTSLPAIVRLFVRSSKSYLDENTHWIGARFDSLDAFPDDASTLAKILFEHTAGNMFFVTQLIRYLVREGVLCKRRESVTWSFDSGEVIRNAIRAATNEVSLLSIVVKKQEQEVQDTLMVASCLGAEFSEFVLRLAVTFSVDPSLQVAELMAFLKRSAHDPSTWRFSHDRIQESAYSLIPIHERERVHLRIGRTWWSKLSARDFEASANELDIRGNGLGDGPGLHEGLQ